MFEESPGIHPGAVADIRPFGIRNIETLRGQILCYFIQRIPSPFTKRLEEGNIRLVRNCEVACRINDPLTELDSPFRILKSFRQSGSCLLYTSPSPRDVEESRMPSSA